jgi:predicted transcriptional regulator of viral defense system
MERVKPKDMALIQRLLSLDKPYFSPADLEKVLGQKRPALYVTLNRLVRYGVLARLGQGVYQIPLRAADLPRIANQLVYPSYLSFESALSRYGILSQSPYALTFATSQRSRHLTLEERSVEFRQLKGELFFGYTLQSGLYVAEPEKALLDQLYMVSRGLSSLTVEELDLSPLNLERLQLYATHFPPTARAAVKRALPESNIEHQTSP